MSSMKIGKHAGRWSFVGVMLLIIGLAAAGCASGGSSEPECKEDFECDFGEYCNNELGVCEASIRNNDNNGNNGGLPDTGNNSNNSNPNNSNPNNSNPNNSNPNNSNPNNSSTPDTGPDAAPDTGFNNNTPDVNPNQCDPACDTDQTCDNGVCVDDQQATCSAKGEPCDPGVADQGNFWCAGDGDGGGECLPKCSETVTAQGCATGEYCWNIGDQSNPAPACIESQCDVHSDCDSNTCINFDNQFGLCSASGSVGEGQWCDPSATNECQSGMFCREEPSGSGQGACRQLCDPWGTSSGCPSGQLCDLFTSRDGICRTDVDATGNDPFYQCSTSGSMCDDGVLCLEFSSDNFCVPYCRTGMNDCAGTSGGQFSEVCNNYVVAGERSWGLCLPACQSNADCCSDSFCPDHECQSGVCRNRCTQGNELQDCCGGTTPCDWTCNSSGFCE
jgi:hypothetical protein